ncbi:MAG: ankyrin repeat domain-containing protein [Gammaproteobacteria bacterium]|nr:ankyrin repeat domain-containing protein [Gammaproteobacteria bacterium]
MSADSSQTVTEQLTERAGVLKKALDGGNVAAVTRLQRALPRHNASSFQNIVKQGITLSETQFVIAREAGYAGWSEMIQATEPEGMDTDSLIRILAHACLTSDEFTINQVLSVRPTLTDESLVSALCMASPQVRNLVDESIINEPTGPLACTPLMYLCTSRFGCNDDNIRTQRIELAEFLIDLGADVNTGVKEMNSVRGYRTALGAAVGYAGNAELVRLLMEKGADINDGPTLYEGSAMWEAVLHQDMTSLELLLNSDPPHWHKCHALPQAMQYYNQDMVNLLLQHGAAPNWTMGVWGFDGSCLHEAVVLDVSETMLRSLLDAGASIDFRDRGDRTALQLAISLDRISLADILLEYGADNACIRDTDRAMGRCFAGRKLQELPNLKPVDHLWLCRAIRWGNQQAAQTMIAVGMNVEVMDDDGMQPLHLATLIGSAALCEQLLNAGANVDAINFAGDTSLDIALTVETDQERIVRLLLEHQRGKAVRMLPAPGIDAVFEDAADALVNGDAETLRSLLAGYPELIRARSSRPHRCTLFHYLGANGFEEERQKTPANALEIIDILIEAGADPNALCYTYRGGPGENTIGLMTSSGHPREAGLTMAMTSAMIAAGAEADEQYRLLVQAYDAVRDHRPLVIDVDAALPGEALLGASMLGEEQLVKAFLDAGVDVNFKSATNTTALHQAAIGGYRSLVELLLDRGADPAIRDSTYDGTAVGWAYAGGHESLAGMLEEVIKTRDPVAAE